jgi:hypothetical protein
MIGRTMDRRRAKASPASTRPADIPVNNELPGRLQQLDRFWKIGEASLKQYTVLPSGQADALATPFGFGAGTLRKARAFARAYPRPEFERLKATCRRHGFVLGRGNVIRLMDAPAEHRPEFLRAMAEGHWSHNRCLEELRRRFGYRRAKVGRKRHRPSDLVDALVGIRDLCQDWRSLYAALCPPKRNDDGSPKPPPVRLPPAVRQQLVEVNTSMTKLVVMAELKLQRARAREAKSVHPARRR